MYTLCECCHNILRSLYQGNEPNNDKSKQKVDLRALSTIKLVSSNFFLLEPISPIILEEIGFFQKNPMHPGFYSSKEMIYNNLIFCFWDYVIYIGHLTYLNIVVSTWD